MNTITVYEAASYFLAKPLPQSGEQMTHLKLQKLVYYAQAYGLAVHDRRIIDTKFEAWAHGPVSPDLYGIYKGFGYKAIPTWSVPCSIVPVFAQSVLDWVWERFGALDAKRLEYLTHEEEPWIEARGSTPYGEQCNVAIEEDTMKKYYSELFRHKETEEVAARPLFKMSDIKKAYSRIDRSSRGTDEQYFEGISEELHELSRVRERANGGWREEP